MSDARNSSNCPFNWGTNSEEFEIDKRLRELIGQMVAGEVSGKVKEEYERLSRRRLSLMQPDVSVRFGKVRRRAALRYG